MITQNDKRLASEIRKYRRRNKFTQQELADKIKVTQKYVQYIESAKRIPSLKLVYKIAKAFGVKVKDLFTF